MNTINHTAQIWKGKSPASKEFQDSQIYALIVLHIKDLKEWIRSALAAMISIPDVFIRMFDTVKHGGLQ